MIATSRAWTAAAALAIAATSACASSGSSTATANGSTAQIRLMAIGIFQSSTLSYPDADAGFRAAAAKINAGGGVKGRKITAQICNDKFDPNGAADCARQAAAGGFVAVVSHYEPFSLQTLPILEAAKIPVIYGSVASPQDGTSPVSFPRDSGVLGLYSSLGVELAKSGCTKVGAVVVTNPNNVLGATWLQRGTKEGGAAFVQTPVGSTQADFAAPVAKLLDQGADCIVPDTNPDAGSKIADAVAQSGKKARLGAITSEFSSTQLQALGAAGSGMILTGAEYRVTDTSVPAVQQVIAGIAKYAPGTPVTDKFAFSAWASVMAVAQIAGTINGEVTAASMLKAAGSTKVDTGLYAPLDPGAAAPSSDFRQAKNWKYLVWTVDNGTATLRSQTFAANGAV